jgi:hypothetical protein
MFEIHNLEMKTLHNTDRSLVYVWSLLSVNIYCLQHSENRKLNFHEFPKISKHEIT